MKLNLWQAGILTLILSWMLSLALVLLSPERFIDAQIQGDSFVQETTRTLGLNERFYLLEPTVLLASRLEQLDYIQSYTIERSLPNQVTVQYQVHSPLACSASTVYYSQSRFQRSLTSRICVGVTELVGMNPDVILESLQQLDPEIRNLIVRIEFQADEALVTLENGQQAIVYPTDLQGLRNIVTLTPRNEVLDLRRNYA